MQVEEIKDSDIAAPVKVQEIKESDLLGDQPAGISEKALNFLEKPYKREDTGERRPMAFVPGVSDVFKEEFVGGLKQMADPLIKAVSGEAPKTWEESEEGAIAEPVMGLMRVLNSPFAAAARGIGELSLATTDSPATAAVMEQAASFGLPWLGGKVAGVFRKGAEMSETLGKEMALEKTMPTGEAIEAEAGRKLSMAEQNQKEYADAIEEARKAAINEAEGRVAPMPTEEEILASSPGEAASRTELGEQFPSLYKTSEETARRTPSNLYNEAHALGREEIIPPEKLSVPLQEVLKERGIAAKVVPTKAESLMARTAEAINPEKEDQEALSVLRAELGDIGFEKFMKGESVSLPAGVFNKTLAPFAGKGLTGTHMPGLSAVSKEGGAVIPEMEMEIPEKMTGSDAIHLRQRLAALGRASKNNDFAGKQFRDMKEIVDKALPENVREKLAEADKEYATKVVPYYTPGAPLRKIYQKMMSQRNALGVLDSLVPKNNVGIVRDAMTAFDETSKHAIAGAWYQRIWEKSFDFKTGRFDPMAFKKEMMSYDPAVRKALLGEAGNARVEAMMQKMTDHTITNEILDQATKSADQIAKEDMAALKERAAASGKTIADEAKLSAKARADLEARLNPWLKPHFGRFTGGVATVPLILGLKDIITAKMTGQRRDYVWGGMQLFTALMIWKPDLMARIMVKGGPAMDLMSDFAALTPGHPRTGAVLRDLTTAITEEEKMMEEEDKLGEKNEQKP